MPEDGAVMSQNDMLMTLIKLAWRTWYVFGFMPHNKMAWKETDLNFIAWTNGTD